MDVCQLDSKEKKIRALMQAVTPEVVLCSRYFKAPFFNHQVFFYGLRWQISYFLRFIEDLGNRNLSND